MQTKWLNTMVERPLTVLLISLSLIVLASMGAKNLVFKTDYRVFFGEDNPQLIAFENMQATYDKNDTVDFVIAPKNGDIFTKENLNMLLELTNDAWQIPYSNRVDSITNFQHTSAEEDDLIVADLFAEEDEISAAHLEKIRAIALKEPNLNTRLISTDSRISLISTIVQLPGKQQTKEVFEVVEFVRDLKARYQEKYPDVEFYLTGMVMMNNSFAESSMRDSSTLVPLMFFTIIIAMLFLLKTVSGTIATVVVIATSIAATMGLAGWAGLYLTGPSASTPTLVMTLAVADCIHILTTLFYEMRRGMEKKAAILMSLRINFKPIFLTSITTAIGFLSLNFSDAPPFHDLGNMVATGVMLAFIFSVTIFPALLVLLPMKVKTIADGHTDMMDKFADFVIRQRNKLLPITSVIMLSIIALIPLNELNDNFVEYFDNTVPFRNATDFMQENIHGLTTMGYSLDSNEPSGVNNPEFLALTERFANWLRAQPETQHVMSVTDTLKRLNQNMHGDDPSFYKLPESQELSAQYLLLYEMSLPYGLDLNNQLNVDKSGTRLMATFDNLNSKQILDIERRAYAWFATQNSRYTLEAASPDLMFAHIGQRNITSMLTGTSLALVLIAFLLGLVLRSARFGFISLFPNLAPAGIAFGAWAVIDGQVGLGLSVVSGMTLGIIVDDTIHFLSKYLHARNDKKLDSVEAVRYAFANVGKALWITTLVLVAGFMVLAQSPFKLNSDMGFLTAVTITIALIVDFLFLPPLLMLLDKKQPATEAKPQPQTTAETANA